MNNRVSTDIKPDNLYIEVPTEAEADLTRVLLMKQLEAVEYMLQEILEESNGGSHRGEDIVDLADTRQALIKVINFNSTPDEFISENWKTK